MIESNEHHFEVKVPKDKGQSTRDHDQRHSCRESAAHEHDEHYVCIVILDIKSIRSHDIFHTLLCDLLLSPPSPKRFLKVLDRHRK